MVPQEDHHVWPRTYGGPNVADNLERVCANAHSDTHYLLELMLRTGDGRVPYETRRTFGPGVVALASRGYRAVIDHAEALAAEAQSGAPTG
jgi:hypothetical protein